jgi:hypothetical protein
MATEDAGVDHHLEARVEDTRGNLAWIMSSEWTTKPRVGVWRGLCTAGAFVSTTAEETRCQRLRPAGRSSEPAGSRG